MRLLPGGKRHTHLGFAAMTRDLDESLGHIMGKLDELNLTDNTYVIYMSDNGGIPNIPGAKKYTQSLNHPLQRGKWDAMEGGIRVPLVVVGPEVPAGSHSGCSVWVRICFLPLGPWLVVYTVCQIVWMEAFSDVLLEVEQKK